MIGISEIRRRRKRGGSPAAVLAIAFVTLWPAAPGAGAGEILFISEGNNLLRVDLGRVGRAGGEPETLIRHAARDDEPDGPAAPAEVARRDINGTICFFADGSGRFVAGEDTGQPDTPPGWGVFDRRGRQIGKLTATYHVPQGEPHGCAFDRAGRLFTSSVGNVGFGTPRGQLILWYPPFDHFPGAPGTYPRTSAASDNFCKIADDIGTAGGVAIDGEGRVYVASSGRGAILRFSPPYPAAPNAAGGCGDRDALGSPRATDVRREVFHRGLYTFSGLAFAPNGHLFASSVFTGEILELDAEGRLVRKVLDPTGLLPPFDTGNPMGLAVDARGDLYYADLDLEWNFPSIGPGPDGKVRRIRFGADGRPGSPETLVDGLSFPDGVSIVSRGVVEAAP